jgi:hypothetical protein
LKSNKFCPTIILPMPKENPILPGTDPGNIFYLRTAEVKGRSFKFWAGRGMT